MLVCPTIPLLVVLMFTGCRYFSMAGVSLQCLLSNIHILILIFSVIPPFMDAVDKSRMNYKQPCMLTYLTLKISTDLGLVTELIHDW